MNGGVQGKRLEHGGADDSRYGHRIRTVIERAGYDARNADIVRS